MTEPQQSNRWPHCDQVDPCTGHLQILLAEHREGRRTIHRHLCYMSVVQEPHAQAV
jgi:hypothetical protein